MREIGNVMGQYGIGIDVRHLMLLADVMTVKVCMYGCMYVCYDCEGMYACMYVMSVKE